MTEKLIAITGINLERCGKQRRRLIAHFDCEIVGIEIKGCTLIRTEQNGIAIGLPQLDTLAAQRGVKIVDNRLRAAVTRAAREAYQKMGGTDLPEWVTRQAVDSSVTPNEAEAA